MRRAWPALVAVRQDHRADAVLGQVSHVALVADHAAAVRHDGHAPRPSRPAAPCRRSRLRRSRPAVRAPREQMFSSDDAARLPSGSLPLRELHAHVAHQIARAGPGAAGRAARHDRVVQVHARDRGLSVGVAAVRPRVVAPHALRSRTWSPSSRAGEDARRHRLVVGGTQLACRGRPRARRRIRRPRPGGSSTGTSRRTSLVGCIVAQELHLALGRGILRTRRATRSPAAGARCTRRRRCLTQHLLRRVRVAELEAGYDLRDRRVPLELALVDEACEQQRRHRLGVRGDDEQRVRVDRFPACRARARRSPLRRRSCSGRRCSSRRQGSRALAARSRRNP